MSRTAITKMGETWDMISRRVYGDERFMSLLIDANISHRDVVVFSNGVTLNVPEMTASEKIGGSSLPPWKR